MSGIPSFTGLGPALRWMRERKNLTLEEVSRRSGIHTSSLSRLERGTIQPKLETLGRVLEGLEADTLDLGLALRLTQGQACQLDLPEDLPDDERAALALTAYGFEDFVRSLVRRAQGPGLEPPARPRPARLRRRRKPLPTALAAGNGRVFG